MKEFKCSLLDSYLTKRKFDFIISQNIILSKHIKGLTKDLSFFFEIMFMYNFGVIKDELLVYRSLYLYWIYYLDQIFICVYDIISYLKKKFSNLGLNIKVDFNSGLRVHFNNIESKELSFGDYSYDLIFEERVRQFQRIFSNFLSKVEKYDEEYIYRFSDIYEVYEKDPINSLNELEILILKFFKKNFKELGLNIIVNKKNIVC